MARKKMSSTDFVISQIEKFIEMKKNLDINKNIIHLRKKDFELLVKNNRAKKINDTEAIYGGKVTLKII